MKAKTVTNRWPAPVCCQAGGVYADDSRRVQPDARPHQAVARAGQQQRRDHQHPRALHGPEHRPAAARQVPRPLPQEEQRHHVVQMGEHHEVVVGVGQRGGGGARQHQRRTPPAAAAASAARTRRPPPAARRRAGSPPPGSRTTAAAAGTSTMPVISAAIRRRNGPRSRPSNRPAMYRSSSTLCRMPNAARPTTAVPAGSRSARASVTQMRTANPATGRTPPARPSLPPGPATGPATRVPARPRPSRRHWPRFPSP